MGNDVQLAARLVRIVDEDEGKLSRTCTEHRETQEVLDGDKEAVSFEERADVGGGLWRVGRVLRY